MALEIELKIYFDDGYKNSAKRPYIARGIYHLPLKGLSG